MSSCVANNVASEQLCYVPCSFCNIVLAVSVPSSSLFDIVTVRCGHCTNLWSVNMAAAAFHSLSYQHVQTPSGAPQYRINTGGSSSSKSTNKVSMRSHQPLKTSNTKPASTERNVNRPPEKKQRVPSAYNQFIKEEIQRIKANNPNISHREAFSSAAKNWAHFPRIHFGLMLETYTKPN